MIVYARPDTSSRRVAMLAPNTGVRALTGFVKTWAGRFRVRRDHGRYKAGDVIWVYTYHGEGYFTVWYRGRMFRESLDFSPYGGGVGKRCSDDRYCFGELDRELRFIWWVKFRMRDGREGWTNRASDFDNTDACG